MYSYSIFIIERIEFEYRRVDMKLINLLEEKITSYIVHCTMWNGDS